MTANYQIPSDLSEKQVEADIAGYFGYMSPLFGRRLRLLDVNEQLTGADKKHYRHGVAYFFQFKKPIGLKSTSALRLPSVKRKNESKLMEIRRFRDAHGLDQSPYTICFPLHGDAATPINELQHNVLHGYEKPPHSRAMYICPTTLSISEYEKSLSVPVWRRWIGDPFRYHHRQSVAGLAAASELFSAPFLRGHATVVPHTTVTTHDHYYSFSKHATDVAFHSPELVEQGPARLSDFFHSEIQRLFRDAEAAVPIEELARQVNEYSRKWIGDRLPRPDQGDSIEWMQLHGKLLMKQFGVRQYIFLADQERLESDRIGIGNK